MDHNNRNYPWSQIQPIKFTKDFSQGKKSRSYVPGLWIKTFEALTVLQTHALNVCGHYF